MRSKRLEGMVALITGAGGGEGGGIGAGIARCLAREGACIAVNDLTPDSAAATVHQLQAMGAEAWLVLGNVADSTQAASLVTATVEQFRRLDILVNNAGITGSSAIVERTSDEEWHQVMNVNLHGPFYTSRAAVPVMRAQGFGRIISISSMAGIRIGATSGACYTASKSGLLGLTRHLAAEVAQYGITVNTILPGAVLTPLIKAHASEEMLRTIAGRAPAQRLADPEEIGSLAAFLASREAGYITGAAIPVDGAMTVLPGDFNAYRSARRDEE